jgi:hypothetical protein
MLIRLVYVFMVRARNLLMDLGERDLRNVLAEHARH